jgi:PAS domain S-box-containing protein
VSADERVATTASTGVRETMFATPIALDRDGFMRRLIASLGHLNEGLLGSEVAGGYVMQVGLSMGAAIEAEYKRFWGIDRTFTVDEYAHVIVDLKQKIHGNFSVVSKDPDKVVVRTTSCPFDAFVRQSPSLCFMTSSVFGGIAARNFGYAKVVLHRRIALGDDGCYVSVHLRPTPEAREAVGREYFPDVDRASPDIAEQLRLMDRLRTLRRELGEASARWEEVIHAAAEAIAVLDGDGRIAYANARWRDLLGVEGDELVGGRLETLALPDDRDRLREALARVRGGERLPGLEVMVLHRDGTPREAVVSGGPIRDEHGERAGVLLIVRDVTAEREAARLKDQFLATASHELRTPIATVRGLAELLLLTLQRQGDVDPAQLEDRLTAIVRETDRLALLGRDLLDASRAQTSHLRVDLAPLDLNDAAAAAVARARALLPLTAAHHEVVLKSTPGPVPVLADRDRLDQVLDNLLDNAIKYSPDGGRIEVAVGAGDGLGSVRVRDRGIGIPEEDRANLFAPFFRAGNASARHFPGLGLGLHLARQVVEAHGGTITIDSSEGHGTTVSVALPAASTSAENG